MSEPFIGEIRMMAFNFPPKNWALCNGQSLPINENQALFSLLGTTYGGNGQTTFGLPDFRSRTPIHVGSGFVQGQVGGSESHTLISSQMPSHTHTLNASSSASAAAIPTNNSFANGTAKLYAAQNNGAVLQASTVGNVGGSQPHNNMQPYSVISFCIALTGIFPSRN